MIGKEFLSLILESDRPQVLESLLKISSRQKAVSHQERVYSNKTIKWLEWKVRGHFNLLGKFQYYLATGRDITERIAAEKKLKANEERFKLAVEGTKNGLWDWDLRTNEAYHSDRFATMLGYEPDELPYTEKAWGDLLHPDDKAKAYKNVDDYLNRRVNEYKSTFRMRCKDGYYRWISWRGKAVFDEHGKPYRFVGFNSDITSRKNAERAFIESEEKYHRLYDTMAEGVIFINREGLIIEANPAAQNILGLSNLQLKDNTLYGDLLITFSRNGRICDKEDHPLMQSLSKGVFINDAVIKFHNLKSKKTKWLSISSAPLYDKDEHLPSRAYAVFSDITDRITSENELRKLNDMLISAQEIAKLGYWSYDLKNKEFIWSQQMFSITGRDNSPEVPSAHELKSILSPESVKIFEEAKSAILKGKSYNIVLKVNIPDQNIKYILLQGSPRIDSKGEVYELFGTAQDISEMKFTQIELEKHRDHLEELVKERTEELEKKNLDLVRYNKLFIGREFRIKELRQDIKALKQEIIELKKH